MSRHAAVYLHRTTNLRNRRDFGNELIKKLNAKRFLKLIYKKVNDVFGATLRHYQVKK